MNEPVSTVIIGAGFAGIGAAIRLQQSGIDDFVILERADRAGGTWRDNTYPGAACDIPSRLYSYSFAPNPDWPHTYSGSADILAYIESMIGAHDLHRRIRFGHNVSGLCYDELAGAWEVSLADRAPLYARTVVLASGPLSTPGFPAIEGIETYTGKRMHSAEWDHGYDFAGKRIAVIGTGASAVQIIPELVRTAGHVTVYQRTPGWVLPRLNRRISPPMKHLYRAVPGAQSVARAGWYFGHESIALGVVWNTPLTRLVEKVAKAHLRNQVRDPWQRRQLTPDYRAGCKRLLMTNDYYPALQRDNCRLVTWPIARICENGIRTAEGVERRFDAIVFATGFEVSKQGTPIPVTGRRGRNLAAEWSHGAYAYKSFAVSGYPNLYFTFGPNSGPGHNSALVYMEAQIDAIVTAISLILDRDLHSLDVFEPAQRTFNERLQRRLRDTTWNSGCRSWYLTEDGFNATMFPGFASQYIAQMRGIDFTRDFRAIARGSDEQKSRSRDAGPSRRVVPAPCPPIPRSPARAR
ncbi:NAD(P)/FAD-dependent oxidoreductase [Aldersonia sp. NBC_00410]|uniref:flavin-containing monooxygenase n=1 Tax=Aldersonia sp. NBC_00410 TaxID=2975954 RepID=UPI00224FA3A4|nr:NAD(P)/FAD-dependent oxidoreductase [Aldersonia sp. NBC_00410]MCX5046179.1 NAD(P)/FAD-dependent oxidoreductase [Aldersonia sp. NBC_00410]